MSRDPYDGAMAPTDLWPTFIEHSARIHGGTGGVQVISGPGWAAMITGHDHCDLNQGLLLDGADADSARRLITVFADAGVPAIVSVAGSVPADCTRLLAEAGFEPAGTEPLMWLSDRPERLATNHLDVREVTDAAGRDAAIGIIVAAHGVEQAGSALPPLPAPAGDVRAWIAWIGDAPASVVWLTLGERIGVWEMMTSPEHRRKGAARCALHHALWQTWNEHTEGAFLWSTPAGRPLYEAVGFEVVAEPTVWALGAPDALLTAIGHAATGG